MKVLGYLLAQGNGHLVVAQSRGILMSTSIDYTPYYGEPQKGTPGETSFEGFSFGNLSWSIAVMMPLSRRT